MARNTNHSGPGGNSMLVGGSAGSYVAGGELKQVDTPVETLLGVANGALGGAVISGGISAVVTLANEEVAHSGGLRKIFQNITGTHLVGVLGGTAAIAALGGLVRFSRARKHNEWSERHYDFLNTQATGERNHAEALDAKRTEEAPKETQR